MIDFISISGTMEDRMIEYVDHLHEHFEDPVTIKGGRYLAPSKPGFSSQMTAVSLKDYAFPNGNIWLESPTENR